MAIDKGALREPGEMTTSLTPASMIWRTITWARRVAWLITTTLRLS